MKTYYIDNDEIIKAENSYDFAVKLRDGSFMGSDKELDEYLSGFAKRYKIYSGKDVDLSSYDAFVESLIKHGFIHKVV